MLFGFRHVPDLGLILIAFAIQSFVASRLFRSERRWLPYQIAAGASLIVLTAAVVLQATVLAHWRLGDAATWVRGFAMGWAGLILVMGTLSCLVPRADSFSAARRQWLGYGSKVVVTAPIAVAFGGFVQRNSTRLTEIDLPISGLPKDLHGLRIVQLTDIHLGPYFTRADLRRAVDMANEVRANVAVVTGDLITSAGDPLDDAIAELRRLRADAGVFGCHGNHEIYAQCEEYVSREAAKFGMKFLRKESRKLRFGDASINLAGVDYQRKLFPYLQGMDTLVEQGNLNVLLSHNPDVFPVARRQGYQVTLAGHTHGGQLNVEILSQNLNAARFVTPYTNGLYQEGGSSVYVSAGLGTIAIPVRVGAPSEVSVIRLCAT